jgi:hypothetical protein
MEMEKKFYAGYLQITKASIPIMLKSFSCGTRFVVTSREWHENLLEERFIARYNCDLGYASIEIRVSNDERRRLIPILKKLQLELSRS